MSPEPGPVTRQACAKINLTFEVLGKRLDGYHEIASVMQAISLCDVLTFDNGHDIRLACDVAELASPSNLVYRAARLMQGLARGRRGVSISLRKGIPLAGGLGGGSSDAAAAMQALNEMWGVNLPLRRLTELAARLGSDVPFFVSGHPTALATGRGEEVEALSSPAKTWLVLLRPPIELAGKTRVMYSHLEPSAFTEGQHTGELADSIGRGKRVANGQCYNAFEPLAMARFRGLSGYRRRFLDAGAGEVHLAGAGPTLFTLVRGRGEGERIVRRLKGQGMNVNVYLAHTL